MNAARVAFGASVLALAACVGGVKAGVAPEAAQVAKAGRAEYYQISDG